MKKMTFLLIVSFFMGSTVLLSQEKVTITGKVTDKRVDIALPGVTVYEKGTSNGTITDFDGIYELEVKTGDVIIFAFVGKKTIELTIGTDTVINVQMEPDLVGLEEVVVVGYGTQKKSNLTGSYVKLNAEKVARIPYSSFEAVLQGSGTGVNVTSANGVPGGPVNIRIRGLHSFNSSNEPLWIIDGMPVYSNPEGLQKNEGTTGQSPMSLINPNDIASIQILKDAAATAIYGSRASNGVIIITTKAGESLQGGTQIDYSSGISTLTRNPSELGYANSQEWFQIMNRAMVNTYGKDTLFEPNTLSNLSTNYPQIAGNTIEERQANAMAVNTNWFDEILRYGSYHDFNISNSKSSNKINSFISLNYREDKGVIIGSNLKRFTTRANIDFEPVKYLKIGAKMNMAYTQNNRFKNDGGQQIGTTRGGVVGAFGQANRYSLPWFPVYDYNSPETYNYWAPRAGTNLVANADNNLIEDNIKQYRALGGLYADYQVPKIKGLSVRSEFSFDLIQSNAIFWSSELMQEEGTGSYASDEAITYQNINYNAYATYNKAIGEDHAFKIVAGAEAQKYNQFSRNMTAYKLNGTHHELGLPSQYASMYSSLTDERYLLAYFGRGAYSFKNRYLVEVSTRQDGSSAFATDYRWGNFNAFSVGWIATEEDFLKDNNIVTYLKLRASYGQTGNQNIPSDRDITTFNNSNRYGTNDTRANSGSLVSNIGVADLTWETTNNSNIGVDMDILSGRINFAFDFFSATIKNMLFQNDLPVSAGVSTIWGNNGTMKNNGIEFTLSTNNITKPNFSWATDFNVTFTKNEVTQLNNYLDDNEKYQLISAIDHGGHSGSFNIIKTGLPYATYYMSEYAGISPELGVEMIYEIEKEYLIDETTGQYQLDTDGNKIKNPNYSILGTKTGRLIPATKNNLENNKIIQEGKSTLPTYYGGFSNNFKFFKNFDLVVLLTFSGGNYIYDYAEQRASYPQKGQVVLKKDLLTESWEQAGDNAQYPELVIDTKYPYDDNGNLVTDDAGNPDYSQNYDREGPFLSRYLYKGDYIRLKNIQLGYNIPGKTVQKLKLRGIRIYIASSNLLTWSYYKGFDPEVTESIIDYIGLPQTRIYSAGISFKF